MAGNYKTSWGDPLTAVRMPRPVLDGLKQMARDQGTTVSAILRDLAIAELKAFGYPITDQPLDGQMTMHDAE